MTINTEIKQRIFTAADELYAENLNGEFPNIEAVRQRSRAGMSNVVEAMKEWRSKQRTRTRVVHDPLPAELQEAFQGATQSLWRTAQQLANETLNAARTAFEAERNDLVELSTEQSVALERQAAELEAAQVRIAELEAQLMATVEQQRQQSAELADLREQNDDNQRLANLAQETPKKQSAGRTSCVPSWIAPIETRIRYGKSAKKMNGSMKRSSRPLHRHAKTRQGSGASWNPIKNKTPSY